MEEMKRPNVLITGTPGTGKTSLSEQLAERCGLALVNVGKLVEEQGLHTGRDEARQAWIMDEDALMDSLEDQMAGGGVCVDYHGCDFFPERWFDVVVCLRADNTVLYDRLSARGYAASKVQENVQAEIMQVVVESARESYRPEVLMELQSDTLEQMEDNVELVAARLA